MPDYQFERTPAQIRKGYKLVRVKVAALDKGLARTPGYHVGKGGVGPSAIKGRYPEAKAFVAKAKRQGTKIHAIEGGIDRAGLPFLDDGRHRFAALRDAGAKTVDLAVPRGQAARVARLFGDQAPPAPPAPRAGVERSGPFNQPLAGQVEPTARTWQTASAADRKAFYQQAGDLAVKQKRSELTRAIGSNGRTMRPRKNPRPDGANGPVLTPHDAASRTDKLMDFRAWDGGVTLFWHSGMTKKTRKPWGTILGYHADGKVRGAPRRDVRLSKRGRGVVQTAMAAWWTKFLRSKPKPKPAAPEGPKPKAGKKPGKFSKAQQAQINKYSYLKDYFRPKGEGI